MTGGRALARTRWCGSARGAVSGDGAGPIGPLLISGSKRAAGRETSPYRGVTTTRSIEDEASVAARAGGAPSRGGIDGTIPTGDPPNKVRRLRVNAGRGGLGRVAAAVS